MNGHHHPQPDSSSSLSHQPGPYKSCSILLALYHHPRSNLQWFPHPSLAIKHSSCPLLPFRIRSMNLPKHSLPRESKILLAMHVGMPISIPYPSPLFTTHLLAHARSAPDRQRKVKCHQLPGQPKVLCCVLSSPSVPSVSPTVHLHCFQCQVCRYTSSRTCPCSHIRSALHSKKLPLHVRFFSSHSSASLRQVNISIRHHAQQATSEKKRISTVNRRPRAYSTNPQQRSVSSFILLPPMYLPICAPMGRSLHVNDLFLSPIQPIPT